MCAAAGFPNSKCQPTPENKVTIEGIIKLAVEETNEAFTKSGIPTKLRAVKVHYEDKYDDTAEAWPTVFSHYTGDKDGNMDYIHAMRDQYGADFVSFIVNTRGYCGSAHRPTEPNAARAFSMVRSNGGLHCGTYSKSGLVVLISHFVMLAIYTGPMGLRNRPLHFYTRTGAYVRLPSRQRKHKISISS